jgi:DNA helicase-2/ATP-dependent DNA helicase PcrA
MHSAKGLIYDVIFIIEMDQEIFPDPNLDIDEQRRLCYVAMTRARKELFVCHANRRTGPPARGQYGFYGPSSFISDIPGSTEKTC